MACQVQVIGPDAKAVKATYGAFHLFRNGRTTLSCSGILLCTLEPCTGEQGCAAAATTAAATAVQADAEAGRAPAAQHVRALVLAPVSCIYPFLQASQRHRLADVTEDSLLPAVEVCVLLRPADFAGATSGCSGVESTRGGGGSSAALVRLPASFKGVLQLPCVQRAAQQLLTSTQAGSGGDWKLGWCLADQQPRAAATAGMLGHVLLLEVSLPAAAASAVVAAAVPLRPRGCDMGANTALHETAAPAAAALAPCSSRSCSSSCGGCSTGSGCCAGRGCTCCCSSQASPQLPGCRVGCPAQGQALVVTGSPFGCLAEQQFHGAVVTGCVSQVLEQQQQQQQFDGVTAAAAAGVGPPLFMLDARCMPGMEGGPVQCRCCGALLGVLALPLSDSSCQVELMLAINAAHLAAALQHKTQQQQQQQQQGPQLQRQPAVGVDSSVDSSTHPRRSSACGDAQASEAAVQQHRAAEVGAPSSSGRQSGQHGGRPDGATTTTTSWQSAAHQQQQQQQLDGDGGLWPPAAKAGPMRRLQVHLHHLSAGLQDEQQHSPQLVPAPAATSAAAATAAATAASANVFAGGGSSSSSGGGCGSSLGAASAAALRRAAAGVVMVRCGRSWGSGVLATPCGLVLSVGHLFRSSAAATTTPASAAAARGQHDSAQAPHMRGISQQQQQQQQAVGSNHSSSGGPVLQRHGARDQVLDAISSSADRRQQERRHGQQQQQQQQPLTDISVMLCVPAAHDSGSSSSSSSSSGPAATAPRKWLWLPARVVYCFEGYLDLAVLQVDPAALASLAPPGLLQPLQLAAAGGQEEAPPPLRPGAPVYVIGHGLFGPRLGWPPAITAGCVARVVALPTTTRLEVEVQPVMAAADGTRSAQGSSIAAAAAAAAAAARVPPTGQQQPQQQAQGGQGPSCRDGGGSLGLSHKPSMIISTAAVRAGASGGALVDGAGRLVGLVTSNARHVRGATLPHLNFCISAAELRPVWDWAQAQAQERRRRQHQGLASAAAGASAADSSGLRAAGAASSGWQADADAGAAARELRAQDVRDAAGVALWALQPFMPNCAMLL